MVHVKITNGTVTFCKNYISEKILVLKLQAKMLSSNQIARFFDHQYLWKESISILEFLYECSHQGKVASEATTFDAMWPDLPSHVQICLD